MKVLVACEESQAVTIEFRKLGHEAYSCDIVECSGGHPEWHLMKDVREVLQDNWDMIIAFPPCTHLCVSGAAWFEEKRKDGRQQEGIDFFMKFTNLDCPKVAIENPVGIMSTYYRKPDQIIQPWMFGDNAKKTTCLWLKGVPPLLPETTVEPELEYFEWIDGKTGKKKRQPLWCYKARTGNHGMNHSKTFPRIAKAMAEQWGSAERDKKLPLYVYAEQQCLFG